MSFSPSNETLPGIWFSCNALSQILGSALAYGFAKTDLRGGFAIPGHKVLFIFLGAVTMAVGVLLGALLPDSPLNARFLNEEERVVAVERIRSNNQGIGNKVRMLLVFLLRVVDSFARCEAAEADFPGVLSSRRLGRCISARRHFWTRS